MKKFIRILTVALLIGLLCASNVTAQEEGKELTEEDAKLAQQKLLEALKALKKEIRSDVSVENGGSVVGTVKCKRVRLPEDVVVYKYNVFKN